MGDDRELYPKNKFLLCITKLEKTDNETMPYKVISSEWNKVNGKEFRNSIYEDRKNGIKRTVEIVNQKPEKFVVNQIYMLATRDRAWIWTEEK